MRKFIPYREIGNKDVLVVDGQHKRCVKLSHWGGANIFKDIEADSSAEIVINAIRKNHSSIDRELVSASHFDIDGFIGVWALGHQEYAVNNQHVLVHMAMTGDFREFDTEIKDADLTLKLVAWINKIEKEKFYPPFGVSNELSSCAKKFDFFLQYFSEIVEHIENYSHVWQDEYNKVLTDIETARAPGTKVIGFKEIGLCVVKTPDPLHYYAITGLTKGYDTVLSIFDNNRYEMEYKYTTWIDMASRPTWPRVKPDGLIKLLNELEKNDYRWYMDRLADSGPILRLIDKPIPKVIRYDQPYKREIFSSAINEEQLIKIVVDYFKDRYKDIVPKYSWTPSEMRKING